MKRPEEDDEMMRHALSLGLSLMTLSACVSQSQWTPTVDTYGSSRAQFVTRDQQECRELAMQTSGSSTGQAARGAVAGGLLGAAAGGGAGRGAAIGAATGGVGAGAVRGVQSNQQFQRGFNQCMRNRGHNVLS
jgi:outer membrane lipoprotein SlyB